MGITGMIYMVTIVFSLIVLILSSSAARYDYFQFTQQYQLAACNSNPIPCKDPPDKLFTIHGLWPSDSNGHDPVNCSQSTVDAQKLGNLTTQLEIIWPNVYNRADHISFWNKQWNKHGTCGHPTIMNDIHYFQTAIKMYITQKQNVSKILSKAKIEPEGKPRKQIDIVNAIRKGTGDKEPKLKCQKNNQVTELVEVTLCSNRNLTGFINCPRHIPNTSRYSCPTKNILY
uniref:S32-RNase n=1 Tax=Pyrus ussuriensis TaxID=309349 RepID=B0FM99_9ROSA|nr:S32-RNase [Pyrus ussuriensis]